MDEQERQLTNQIMAELTEYQRGYKAGMADAYKQKLMEFELGYLVLNQRTNEKLLIGENIEIIIKPAWKKGHVPINTGWKYVIKAPKGVDISREKIGG